ncbi:hypothetical protein LJC56_03430 [Christensenellaceae bacterium OttesenSCG-928-K19]|nr:hypothetical protein [Christensenellaceae bacterium OttesenSCG-928-K19]
MTSDTNKKIPWGKIAKIAGGILTVVSIIFVIRYFIQMDIDFSLLLNPQIILSIILSGATTSFALFLLACGWKTILGMFSTQPIPTATVVEIYGQANLSKYVPGNFMHYAMRNILGKKYDLSQKHMLISSILELMLVVLAGIVLVAAFAWNGLIATIRQTLAEGILKKEWIVLLVIAAVIVVIALLVYMKKKGYLSSLRRKSIVATFSIYAASLFVNSIAFFITLLFIDAQAALQAPFTICGFFLISWLVGTLVPGAPGGLGIREYVMLLLLAQFFSETDIALVLIVSRLGSVLGDVLMYLVALLLKKNTANKEKLLGDIKVL